MAHLNKIIDLPQYNQTDSRQNGFPQMHVIHQVKGPHMMLGHQLVFIGTRTTIKTQGDEQEEDTWKGGRGGRE